MCPTLLQDRSCPAQCMDAQLMLKPFGAHRRESSAKQLAMIISLAGLAACGGGSAGGPAPAASASVPINTAGWSDSPFISRDGQRLYFMYSRWNFFPTFTGGLPALLGPDRPDLQKQSLATNPYDESDIYVATRHANGGWSDAQAMPFNFAGGDASGMEVGDSFYYARSPGGGANPDIFVSTRSGSVWSTPQGLSAVINSNHVEDNPHVAATEDAIWFSSDRPGGYGGKDLYFSVKAAGQWSAPVNLGPVINSSADEDQPWADPQSNWFYFNRSDGKIYRTQYLSGSFTAPEEFVIPGQSFVAEISFTDDGQYAFFASADTTTQRLRIMYMQKQINGNWGSPTPVD